MAWVDSERQIGEAKVLAAMLSEIEEYSRLADKLVRPTTEVDGLNAAVVMAERLLSRHTRPGSRLIGQLGTPVRMCVVR
jgi:hypothetical protein